MNKITTNLYSKIIIGIFLIMVVYWVLITTNNLQDTIQNFLYGAVLGVLPILGAIFGFINAKKWGWLKSSMGKSVFLLSSGLLTWGLGTLIFAYYNIFLQIAVPYPSLADVFYIVSWPLWAWGMLQLSSATGVKYSLRSLKGKLLLLIIPALMIAISYYLLVVVIRGGILDFHLGDGGLKLFFDLAYPIGDVVILTLTTLIYGLSYNYLGGKFKTTVYIILIGFIINYIADFLFSYTTTLGTFYTGGLVDLVFTMAMFTLSLGIAKFDPEILSKDIN